MLTVFRHPIESNRLSMPNSIIVRVLCRPSLEHQTVLVDRIAVLLSQETRRSNSELYLNRASRDLCAYDTETELQYIIVTFVLQSLLRSPGTVGFSRHDPSHESLAAERLSM